VSTLGCSDDTPALPLLSTARQPIINGTPDTTHQAVVAVAGNNWACTGTIIDVDLSQGVGYVLTAAHCVEQGPPQYVLQGNDYDNADAQYPVTDYASHPNYSQPVYDFAMLQIASVSAATPVIPAMNAAQDNLSSGTQVRHVGYGKTSFPNGDTTIRHETLGNLNNVDSLTIDYLQPTSGPCQGDSGGPQLTVGGTELVAGVVSSGDDTCSVSGISGRTSSVYDTFIVPYIQNTPFSGPQNCDECQEYATLGQGPCANQVAACFNNADCDTFLNCAQGCMFQTCVNQCATDHPTGAALYQGIFDCVCDTACPSQCGGDAICNQTIGSAASSSSGGAVSSSGGAGGGAGVGGGASAGAGAGAPGTGWVAGNSSDLDYDGTVLTSGCSVARGAGSHSGGGQSRAVWLLGLAAFASIGRRRRRRA
jgi:hypothetical protein